MHPLDKEKIIAGLNIQNVDIHVVQEISSTNDFFSKPGHSPSVCIAEKQSAGRGRINRVWHSPIGTNIYMSLVYKFNNTDLSTISLITGLAVRDAIEKYICLLGINVKWPNDILYQEKKLGGILIESQIAGKSAYVIAGIGINVNLIETTKIHKPWTSLQKITNTIHDRNSIISAIINNILLYYKRFEKDGFKDFIQEWNNHDILLNKVIRVTEDSRVFEGKSLGINSEGNLLLKVNDGEIKCFNYGETSILSINFPK